MASRQFLASFCATSGLEKRVQIRFFDYLLKHTIGATFKQNRSKNIGQKGSNTLKTAKTGELTHVEL